MASCDSRNAGDRDLMERGSLARSSLASAEAPARVASRPRRVPTSAPNGEPITRAWSPPGAVSARRRLCHGEAAGGEPAELVPGADVQLQEDLVQVVLDGSGTDEQPRADIGVGEAVPRELRDLRFLRCEYGRLLRAPVRGPAGR